MYQCNEILRHGIVDESIISTERSVGDSLYAWLRRSDYSTVRAKMEGGLKIGLPIKNVPIQGEGQFSENDFNEWKRQVDAGNGRAFTETESIVLLQRTISTSVVEAWKACIKQQFAPQVGLVAQLDVLEQPEHLALSIRYIPDRPTDMPPTVVPNGFQVLGATAVSPLNAGDEIPFGGIGTLLSRDRYNAVSVQINTTAGEKTLSVPGVPREEPRPSKEEFKIDMTTSGSSYTAIVTGPARWLSMIVKVKHVWLIGVHVLGITRLPSLVRSDKTDALSRFSTTQVDSFDRKIYSLTSRLFFDDGEEREYKWTRP